MSKFINYHQRSSIRAVVYSKYVQTGVRDDQSTPMPGAFDIEFDQNSEIWNPNVGKVQFFVEVLAS